MQGFGVHTSMWTMNWDRAGAERAVAAAVRYKMDFIEIALLNAPAVDAAHTRAAREEQSQGRLLARPAAGLLAVAQPRSRGRLSQGRARQDCGVRRARAERRHLRRHRRTHWRSADARRVRQCRPRPRGRRPACEVAWSAARPRAGESLRVPRISLNTGAQAAALIERIGADNMFVHLDTYHMNIEEKGAALGILAARKHLKYIHLSESDRGTPGAGNCRWDENLRCARRDRLQGRSGDGKLHQHDAGCSPTASRSGVRWRETKRK